MVEKWLYLRDRYVSLMGQIGDFQITSGPYPSYPEGYTPTKEEADKVCCAFVCVCVCVCVNM